MMTNGKRTWCSLRKRLSFFMTGSNVIGDPPNVGTFGRRLVVPHNSSAPLMSLQRMLRNSASSLARCSCLRDQLLSGNLASLN